MNISTILAKKPGFIVPEAFIRNIVMQEAHRPNFFGFVVQHEGDLPVHHATIPDDREDFLTNMGELLGNIKNNSALIYFGNGKFTENAYQPFVIPGPDGKSLLAIAVEGDFSKFAEADSNEERNFIDQWAGQRLVDIYELTGGNYDKFLSTLKGSLFADPFNDACSHRGVFSFLGNTGDPVMFGKNQLGADYDWGSASQTCGYTEKVDKPEVAEKKSNSFANMFSKPATSSATPSAEPKKDEAPTPKKTSVPSTTPAIVNPDKKPSDGLLHPPSTVRGNSALKDWYRAQGYNNLPEGWKQRVGVRPNVAKTDLTNLKEHMEGRKGSTAVVGKPSTMIDTLPYLDKKELIEVKEFINKYVDGNSNSIADPKTAFKIEKNLPLFSEQLGIKIDVVKSWPESFLVALGTTHPKALAALASELRLEAFASPDVKGNEEQKPAEVPAPISEPVKKEPEAQPVVTKKPAGFSLFSKKVA